MNFIKIYKMYEAIIDIIIAIKFSAFITDLVTFDKKFSNK